jgi:hypothetical protein
MKKPKPFTRGMGAIRRFRLLSSHHIIRQTGNGITKSKLPTQTCRFL